MCSLDGRNRNYSNGSRKKRNKGHISITIADTQNIPSAPPARCHQDRGVKEGLMTCDRCHGLMVTDDSVDMDERDGLSDVKAWRCVQCGEWIDNVILRNRLIQQGTLAHEGIT